MWLKAGPRSEATLVRKEELIADSRTSKSGGSSLVSRDASLVGERETVKGETYRGRQYLVVRDASLVKRTVLGDGKRKRGYAADFLTRTSARCPVAARTRMSTSVDTP